MENIIAGMKEKADFPEKVRDNTRSKIVEEDGFIVEIVAEVDIVQWEPNSRLR